jgi:sulfur carrier protein
VGSLGLPSIVYRQIINQLTLSCMVYYVNNTPQESPTERTLEEVLTELNLVGQRGMAVAVNDTVVPRPDWAQFALQANDRLTIIRATQGG